MAAYVVGFSPWPQPFCIFGLSRKSIRKMLQFSLPPGHERKKPILRPKPGPWLGIIDQILVDDKGSAQEAPGTRPDRIQANGFSTVRQDRFLEQK
jgi:hypothetical protein